MISTFWWGSKNGKRKVSWVSWENLCLPKHMGGVGFKDISVFNQALLAKQAWRILSSPESLVSKVLQAKYFPNSDFLASSAHVGCSHIWRSIVWGKELLEKGLRWNVGDGSNLKVFKDKWIFRPSFFKPVTFDQGINWTSPKEGGK